MERRWVCLVLGVFAASAQAATVLSENFNELTPGPSATSVGQFSTIGGTNIDIVGSVNGSYFPALCAARSQATVSTWTARAETLRAFCRATPLFRPAFII